MTQKELKDILCKSGTITISFNDNELIKQTEKLLLDNGYKWRGRNNGDTVNLERYSHLVIFINFNGHEKKILSHSTSDGLYFSHHDIIITPETYRLLKLYFNPIPDYKPKKFSREI